jgi:hypothetical protein
MGHHLRRYRAQQVSVPPAAEKRGDDERTDAHRAYQAFVGATSTITEMIAGE